MRSNDLRRYLDTVLHVGQLEADLGSPDRLQVIDWTPFVNQPDPLLYSDTRPREKRLLHASLLGAAGEPRRCF
jgi:hypothetical protein